MKGKTFAEQFLVLFQQLSTEEQERVRKVVDKLHRSHQRKKTVPSMRPQGRTKSKKKKK